MPLSKDDKILVLFAIAFIVIFFAFYPKFYWAPDEHQNLRNAYLISSGRLAIDNPLYSYSYIFNGQEYVSLYPPLYAIFLIPFALAGWQFAFLSGLFFHLLNTFIFYKILKKLKIPAIYALLFLLLPAFVFESKGLFSELSSLSMIMLGYYFYLNKDKRSSIASGAFFGLSLLVRYTNALALMALGVVMLFKNRKKLVVIAASAVPFVVLLLLYNNLLYGSPLATAYQLTGLTSFGTELFVVKFLYFVLLLSVIYPLMFFSPLFAKGRLREEAFLSAVFMAGFFSLYRWTYFNWAIEDLVSATAKLIPIIFLLLITYTMVFERLLSKANLLKHRSKIIVLIALLMLVPAVVVQFELQQKQDLKFDAFQEIYERTEEGSLIVADEQFDELPGLKESPFTGMLFMEAFGDRKLTTLKQPYQQYIDQVGEENTYYMRIWMEGGEIEVEIMPWSEFVQARGNS